LLGFDPVKAADGPECSSTSFRRPGPIPNTDEGVEQPCRVRLALVPVAAQDDEPPPGSVKLLFAPRVERRPWADERAKGSARWRSR
jgi:hypothetical protein